MQNKSEYILGIDTSNYKTSVAIIDRNGNIVCDHRQLLRVKQGERGLRQSDALFQHVENLPQLIETALSQINPHDIKAVAYSDKPRPIEGSYMPVFKAGIGMGQAIAASLQIPHFAFSHQEGHIKAIQFGTPMENLSNFLCYHLSGGTCELLKVSPDCIEIIGGSKDISFGQVIDRVGVKLGMQFPAGEFMDQAAIRSQTSTKQLKKISKDGLYFNLSGIETQCSRAAEQALNENCNYEPLIRELMDKLAQLLIEVTRQAGKDTGINHILFTGGVSSSRYISGILKENFADDSICIEFGKQSLSQDNAVGIALLGGEKLWQSSR